MTSCTIKKYTEDSLCNAIEAVQRNELSLRKAAQLYGVPKSTLSMYVSGELKVGARRGPASIPNAEEEPRLVDHVVHE